MEQTPTVEGDTSTQQRILAATAEVLGRNGKRKLSLSDVATQAGVSRPTLYRWFASKEELLSAFSQYERHTFESGMSRATAGLKGADKLDAALRFIVDYQHSYTGVRMVDIEPEHVITQFSNVIPQMRDGLQRLDPRSQRRGQGGHRDPSSILALHDSKRRCRRVLGPVAPRSRNQGGTGLVEQHRGIEVAGRVEGRLQCSHRRDIGGFA